MKKPLIALAVVSLCLLPAIAVAKSHTSKPPKDTTPPSITSLSIGSSGSGPAVAHPGDTVTISFTASESIEQPIVLAQTRPILVRAISVGNNGWEASYTVTDHDPLGDVDYLLTLVDTAGNVYTCSSVQTRFQLLIKYCPTTDGSSVTVTHDLPPPPPPPADTTAPAISGTPVDFSVQATSSRSTFAAVSYATPTALDDRDGAVAVVCAPASGTDFVLGTTTVTCVSHDAAGNAAQSSFAVGVYAPAPLPFDFTAVSQTDDTFKCEGFEECFAVGVPQVYDLGQGSAMQEGPLLSVTIANGAGDFVSNPLFPNIVWNVTIVCFTDASYSTHCPDWVAPNAHNGGQTFFVTENATTTTDNTHWTAYFTNTANESAFGGASPVLFNPAYYYRLQIDDQGWDVPVYGSEALNKPYWLIRGLH